MDLIYGNKDISEGGNSHFRKNDLLINVELSLQISVKKKHV